MAFSLRRFLRLTDSDMVVAYFSARRIELAKIFGELDDEPTTSDQLEAAILELPIGHQAEILCDFVLADQLTSSIGQRELRQVLAARSPHLLEKFDSIESAEGRGLFALLKDRPGLDCALAVEYVESRREKSQWSSFNVEAALEVSTAEEARNGFIAVASRLFREFDGSGRQIEVSRFDRPLLHQGGEPSESVIQINLNVEGQPESQLVFHGPTPNRQVWFPAIEAAVVYQPESGVLAVTSRGGRPMHTKLAKAFVEHFLQSDGVPVRVELRLVHLEKLRRPMAFDRDPADGIESVRVTQLRLFSEDHGHRRIQLDLGPNADETMTEFGQHAFPNDNPLIDDAWWVKSGAVKFSFAAEAGQRRGQSMLVRLTHPNGCNIKEQRLDRQAMAEKYLRRWGILERLL